MIKSTNKKLQSIFDLLFDHFGPQLWWPGDTALEIIVGAILTQNTSWTNVLKAISNLKDADALDARRLHEMEPSALAELLRPAGYFNVKTKRLKAFMEFLCNNYNGDPVALFAEGSDGMRERLLAIHGVGEETADSILLYAGEFPFFVVDAYTKRIFSRLGIIDAKASYQQVQSLFMDNLPIDVSLYNEYHALLVAQGKHNCRPKPGCAPCPLKRICPEGKKQ